MTLTVELIIAYIILIPFFIINIFFSMGSMFQKRVSKFLQKTLKEEDQVKDSLYVKFKILNLLIWIVVGCVNVFLLDYPISLGALIVFLAFRGGLSLSRRFIFGIHDIKIIKQQFSDKKITKIISSMIRLGIIVELLFLLTWGILYRYLSISVRTAFGIEVNILTILLWTAGLIYGIIFSLIQSHLSNKFLLKNEIGIALVLSGQIVKEKVKEKKNFVQKLFKL